MSLRRVPSVSYSTGSKLGQKIAERLSSRMEIEYTQNHKEFLQEGLEMLIFDRSEDPVTPLIYNWSYQALVHEFMGIETNSVKVKGTPEIFARQTEDDFLDENWKKNFGEFTKSLSEELEKLYKQKSIGMQVKSLDDMQEALEKLPDLSKEAKKVKKHSEIIKILMETIKAGDIYSVSQLQQDIITENNKNDQFTAILNILAKKNVSNSDKLKLVMIFCLKYNDDIEKVSRLKRAISIQNIPEVD